MQYQEAVATEVIQADHRLEQEADRAGEALAKHRWHWTLDESNPDRVSFSAYARAVGRDPESIRKMVTGYVRYVESRDDPGIGQASLSLQDHVQLEGVKQADREIVEETAKGLGLAISNTRAHHKDDVSRVRDAVAEATEREPDITPERRREVARRTASNIAESRKVEREGRERLRERKSAQAVLIEGELAKARYGLIGALNYAREVDPSTFPADFLDQLHRSLGDIDALLKLLRSALGGAADIDWDAELAKLDVS
jgi:predicted  nucleic acid-binding Zn-ribbon protein